MFMFYGCGWCYLCDDMCDVLVLVVVEFGVVVDYIDIDIDVVLVVCYDEDVFVLLLDGVEVCCYWFDDVWVCDVLVVWC